MIKENNHDSFMFKHFAYLGIQQCEVSKYHTCMCIPDVYQGM